MAGVEFAQENPLGSDEAADVISDDPESTPLLGRRVADLEARLAKHEQVLGTGGSAQSTIRGVLAHLGKTPTNWCATSHLASHSCMTARRRCCCAATAAAAAAAVAASRRRTAIVDCCYQPCVMTSCPSLFWG
jgi:hypothetical protein